MESALVPVLAVGIAAVAVACTIVIRLRWKRRRERWAAAALELGMDVACEASLLDRFGALPYFQKGRGRKVRNLIGGPTWGAEAWLADYQYTTGAGKSQRTDSATVCILRDPALSLPAFELVPERPLADRFAAILGLAEIDFDDDPEFSDAFRLTGADEAAIRATFTCGVRSRLVERPERTAYVAGAGDVILVHDDRLVDPRTAQDLLRQVREIHAIFRA